MNAEFFKSIRASLFDGSLKQDQVSGLNDILDATRGLDIKHRAYILATAYHETGRAMKPNVENLNYTSAERIRKVFPTRFPSAASAMPFVRSPVLLANKVYNNRMGNRSGSDDGWNYRGRGQVHLTGRTNYERAGRKLGIDLVNNPDLALRRDLSARILVAGMTEGWFTGVKLADCVDYVSMRRVVNGMDEAGKIASYAVKFEAALNLIQGGAEPRRALLSVFFELLRGLFKK